MTDRLTYKCYAYISGAWVELNDIAPIAWRWGLSGNETNDRVADIGELRVALNNSEGLYSPDNPSALAGWKKGLPFKLVVTFDNVDFVRFRGIISDIQIRPTHIDKKAYITVLDWMDYASRHKIINLGIETDKRADEALSTLLGEIGITPQAQSIDTGAETFPTVFDLTTGTTTAYDEFVKIAASELGYIYLRKDQTNGETLKFESANARNGWVSPDTFSFSTNVIDPYPGFMLLEDGDYLLLENGDKLILDEVLSNSYLFDGTLDDTVINDYEVLYGDNIINSFYLSVHPRKLLTESVPKTIELLIGATAQLASDTPTVNYADGTEFGVGEYNAGVSTVRTLIKPFFNELPTSGIKFISATLRLTPVIDQSSNARTLSVHRILRNIDHTGTTWYEGWHTNGCSSPTEDYDGSIAMGTATVPASPTIGSQINVEFTAAGVAELQKMYDGTYTNNGMILFVDTQSNDQIYYAGVNNTTPGYKPVIILTYYRDVLFSLDKEIIIGSGETVTIKGNYTDPDTGLRISAQDMVTPVATTDYSVYTESGGAGSDITADLSLESVVYGSEGFTHQVKNNNERVGYITRYGCRGVGIVTPNPIEYEARDQDSIDEFGSISESLRQKYKNDLYAGRVFVDSVVEKNKTPITVLNSVSYIANKTDACMTAFLFGDIGDMININIPDIGIDGNYYIQSSDCNINGGIAYCKWGVKYAPSLLSGLTPLSIEFSGGTSGDGINFGNIPSSIDLTARSWAAWIYLDADPASFRYIFGALSAKSSDLGAGEYGSGYSISAYTGRKIQFSQEHTGASSAAGIWRTPTDSIPLTAWAHIVVTHNITTPTAAPVIYINGSAQTLTTAQTPVGAVSSEVGNSLVIGNNKSTLYDYDLPFDGKIFDPRLYNRVLSAAEVTTLYNGGTPDETLVTSGLIFQGLNTQTAKLSDYTDQALTGSLKVIENILNAVGAPNGAPTGRSAP